MIQVLFVCLGNICRSPIAEGVFRELIEQKGLHDFIQCDSAGTAAYHIGSLPDKRMRAVASKNGITLTHTSRQLSLNDFTRYTYMMAMDQSNFDNIQKESFRANGVNIIAKQLYLYRMFDPQRGDLLIVPDPYYEEISAFNEVYDIVKRSGITFLDFLIEKHNLTVKQVTRS